MHKVSVHNNWDPLEEIWLGDTWPANFYDDETDEVRDAFYQVTEWTKKDLDSIQKKFEEFGVIVRRPVIDESRRDLYTINKNTRILRKPPICPRDTHGVIGDKLFVHGDLPPCYEPLYDLYSDHIIRLTAPDFAGCNVVKFGKDVIIDHNFDNDVSMTKDNRKKRIFRDVAKFEKNTVPLLADYRLHYSTEGGHMDSCYMPVKEKLVLTTSHMSGYDQLMPGWKTLGIRSPSYMAEEETMRTKNLFMLPGRPGRPERLDYINKWQGNFTGMMDHAPEHFTNYIRLYCKEWIGNYKETYFEVNVVPIDDKNLICIDTSGIFDGLFNDLEKNGITCHIVPWRTRGFWDGGIHCITLDVRRKGEIQDYFPDRGEPGLKTVRSELFNKSSEQFLKEYNEWKLSDDSWK